MEEKASLIGQYQYVSVYTNSLIQFYKTPLQYTGILVRQCFHLFFKNRLHFKPYPNLYLNWKAEKFYICI